MTLPSKVRPRLHAYPSSNASLRVMALFLPFAVEDYTLTVDWEGERSYVCRHPDPISPFP